MIVFLLWFSEWEVNHVLGIFESRETATLWKQYFIENPVKDGFVASDMESYSRKDDYAGRFKIEERIIGQLDPRIQGIDNLKFLEMNSHD